MIFTNMVKVRREAEIFTSRKAHMQQEKRVFPRKFSAPSLQPVIPALAHWSIHRHNSPAMSRRAIVIVLDSVGIGHAPDAASYGDAGADTLGHLFDLYPEMRLPNLFALGLGKVMSSLSGRRLPRARRHPGSHAVYLTESSAGKDTTTGHWEIAGHVLTEPFATFTRFPGDLVGEIARAGRTSFIGNFAASGTEIIDQLGEEHIACGHPILYTSADSVLQIAAHEEVFGLERLWELCRTARTIIDRRGLRIGRVIARPFTGNGTDGFRRTTNRHDYSLAPPHTVLDTLQARGVRVHGVGKIHDIFAGRGIDTSHPTSSNAHGMATLDALCAVPAENAELVFANLVDFDSLFGHRRDPAGYAAALVDFDQWLGEFLQHLNPPDLLAITADHGNDPTWTGTDHTRERVPMLVMNPGNLPDGNANFTAIAKLLADFFHVTPYPAPPP